MGWAKYLEDDIGIFNDRMYEKGISLVPNDLHKFRVDLKASLRIIDYEEEYKLVLQEIAKLDKWLNLANCLREIIKTEFVHDLLDKQKEQILKFKEEFINYKYDSKFSKYNNKKNIYIDNSKVEEYHSFLLINYVEYFLDKYKEMNNKSREEALQLNIYYQDIHDFAESYFSYNKSTNKILFKFLREDIQKKREFKLVKCCNCNSLTYIDFKTCIECKYPRLGE